jgi:hypothetical protein
LLPFLKEKTKGKEAEFKVLLKKMSEYIEFSLNLPFYDLVYNSWCADGDKQHKDNHEIMAIADWLGILLDTNALMREYEKVQAGAGDVFVFFNPNDSQIFLYFDFFNDVTDQCGMIEFGLRCPRENRDEALKLIDPLFFKGGPRSALSMDWSNEMLLRKVETPDFYLKNRVLHRFPFKQVFDLGFWYGQIANKKEN